MIAKIWYSSLNPADRRAVADAAAVAARESIELVVYDRSNRSRFRPPVPHAERVIDRPFRVYPTFTVDTDDGTGELARVEGAAVTPASLSEAVARARRARAPRPVGGRQPGVDGEIFLLPEAEEVFLYSPDGTRWRVRVADDGTLSSERA